MIQCNAFKNFQPKSWVAAHTFFKDQVIGFFTA